MEKVFISVKSSAMRDYMLKTEEKAQELFNGKFNNKELKIL